MIDEALKFNEMSIIQLHGVRWGGKCIENMHYFFLFQVKFQHVNKSITIYIFLTNLTLPKLLNNKFFIAD